MEQRNYNISLWDGFAAFDIDALGGALTAATGGAIAASAGLSVSTVAGGALAGASGAAFGSPVQGIGNAMYFGDAYGGGQFLTDVLAGGVLGGVAGGVAGWIKNAKSVKVGGPKIDPWGSRPLAGEVFTPPLPAAISGLVNLGIKAFQGKINSWSSI